MSGYNCRVLRLTSREEAVRAIREVGADREGAVIMASKALFYNVRLDGLSARAANILKQSMLSLGGEAAVHRDVVTCAVEKSGVLLMGTWKHYRELIKKLRAQPFGLKRLAEDLETLFNNLSEGGQRRRLDCRGRELILGERTLVMGILNITPDSFSDGGRFQELDIALEHAGRLEEEGADIIDIGAESTRPGAPAVSEEEELARLLPVLKALLRQARVPVSVDTYKAKVAEEACRAGANLLNDVWGGRRDSLILEVAARYKAPIILMHNQAGNDYHNLLGEVVASLRESAVRAVEAGVDPGAIVLDPGIGFGKNTEQNLEVLRRLGELKSLGYPVLLGTSRKSVIGNTLGLPVDQRLEGTAATVALGIAGGADIIRVHDVGPMLRVARMADAILRPVPPVEPEAL